MGIMLGYTAFITSLANSYPASQLQLQLATVTSYSKLFKSNYLCSCMAAGLIATVNSMMKELPNTCLSSRCQKLNTGWQALTSQLQLLMLMNVLSVIQPVIMDHMIQPVITNHMQDQYVYGYHHHSPHHMPQHAMYIQLQLYTVVTLMPAKCMCMTDNCIKVITHRQTHNEL